MNFFQRLVAWYRRPKSKTQDFVESLFLFVPLAFIIRTIGFGLYEVPSGSMETTMLVGERFFADKFTILFVPPKYGDVISFNDPNFSYSDGALKNWWQMYVFGPSNWTKRVIGVPGDHIVGTIEDGKPVIYRNGNKLEEHYINQYPLLVVYNPAGAKQLKQKSYVPELSLEQQPFYRVTPLEKIWGKRKSVLYGLPELVYPYTPVDRVTTFGTSEEHPVDVFDVHLRDDEYWVMGDNRQGSNDSRFWGPLKRRFIHGKIVLCLYSIDTDDFWGAFEWAHIFIFDMLRHPLTFWQQVRWGRCLRRVL